MSFFEPPPPPPEPEWEEEPRRPWDGAPDNVVGVAVPAQLVLARSESAVIVVSDLVAYPTGVAFELRALWRRRRDPGFLFAARFRHGALDDDVLRLGIEFADRRRVTNLRWPDDEEKGPVLTEGGGGGSDTHYDSTFWLWPLPPPGPLTFVVQWPAESIPETRAELDGQLVVDAAARAVELWPEHPRRFPGGGFSTQIHFASSPDDEEDES